ncbi:MAG: Lsr2 family protein [Bifidobacteriaceae bacterium]|jgi:hypothetical protein|nr:Lsr2 family protein [Bifidobacteriaceae bacterium]
MAQRVVVELLDDLDQTPATATVEFGLDGINYTIDLNDAHAAELRAFLEPYAKVGRRPGSKRPGSGSAPAGAVAFDPAAVRAWADSNGIKVSKRGRVPAWVVEKYHEAGY